MKASELRASTQEQLNDTLVSLRKEQCALRFKKSSGEPVKSHVFLQLRRDIARVKTVMREKSDENK